MNANPHQNRNLFARPLDLIDGRVDLTHGGGGRAMAQLISELFASAFDNPYLAQGNDMAVMPPANGRLVMSTDGYVVSPIFFPPALMTLSHSASGSGSVTATWKTPPRL